MSKTIETYAVCQPCAVAVAYGDTSGVDPECLPGVEASIEAMGLVACTGEVEMNVYWECFVCDDTLCHGEAYAFETL